MLALCYTGCGTFLPKTRFAHLIVNDPHPDDYRPVLHDLMQTVLPFEHNKFPAISPDVMESRLLSLFPVEVEERFLVFRKSLMFFNALDLFPHVFAPITWEEKKALLSDNTNLSTAEADISRKRVYDEQLYMDFLKSADQSVGQFTKLSLEQKREYLRMWGRSGFLTKRQFYRSSKSLMMITAYSMDELWKAIGYDGPLLAKR